MTVATAWRASATGLAIAVGAGCAAPSMTDDPSLLVTRAERTRWEQTTGYGEVRQLLDRAAALSDRAHVTTFGTSAEGRPLPLIVVGDVEDARPAAVTAADRTRIWIQANIHGGEVAGKEALLMLLRDLVAGSHDDWLSSLTLLIAPLYNADGNERIAPDNRPYQLGPLAGMGTRGNAGGLDLNRDHIKLESAEARALVRAYQDYDPHVVVDLHTTNGTEHAYHLTYAPPLHPNTHPDLDRLLRDEWLPTITTNVRARRGWETYHYGNVPRGTDAAPTWRTFDHRPRFNSNYVGLRNRLAILSEAYAYAPFDERVGATLTFVEELLSFAADRADAIAALVETAAATPIAGTRLAVRAEPRRSTDPAEILLGRTEEVANPYTGAPMRRRLDVVEPTPMDAYIAFAGTAEETVPRAYFVPPDLTAVVDLLAAHGVEGAPLETAVTLAGERFLVSASRGADRLFEGHRIRTVDGAWEPADLELPAGTLRVPTDQPLGRLLFTLLEPRSDDGLVAWNYLDDTLEASATYPVLREPVGAESAGR